MKLKDITPNSTFDELIVRVISKNGPRLVGRTKKKYLTEILILDDTKSSVLTLWGKKYLDQIKLGKIIIIKNGWVKSSYESLQVSLGREGTIEFTDNEHPEIPKSIPLDY